MLGVGVPPIGQGLLVASDDLAVLHLDRRGPFPAELAHEHSQLFRVKLLLAIRFEPQRKLEHVA
jgi:hypothetical protein